MFKIVKGYEDVDRNMFFQLKTIYNNIHILYVRDVAKFVGDRTLYECRTRPKVKQIKYMMPKSYILILKLPLYVT